MTTINEATVTHLPFLQTVVRSASPLAFMVAIFLFFAGHNRPGGGFAAGLVLGAIVALRLMAGLRGPGGAVPLLSAGATIIGLVGMAPLLFGRELLDQVIVKATVPVLGVVKSGSAAVFDLGVTLVVVGLVVAVFDGLASDALAPGDVSATEEDTP